MEQHSLMPKHVIKKWKGTLTLYPHFAKGTLIWKGRKPLEYGPKSVTRAKIYLEEFWNANELTLMICYATDVGRGPEQIKSSGNKRFDGVW